MKFILGKKLEMTTIWQEDGRAVPATVIQVGPAQVTQVKTKEKDGYLAVQVGFGIKKKMNKPSSGHLKGLPPFRYLREFLLDEVGVWKRGSAVTIEQFNSGDLVDVIGISKGRGFQGVVKRHGFSGQPATHGHKDQLRMPGSIGAGGVQHVRKGTRMAGRMGGTRATAKKLEVVQVDKEKQLLYIKGAVPGGRNSLLMIVSKD